MSRPQKPISLMVYNLLHTYQERAADSFSPPTPYLELLTVLL